MVPDHLGLSDMGTYGMDTCQLQLGSSPSETELRELQVPTRSKPVP